MSKNRNGRPGKSGPAPSRLIYPRPLLRVSTRVMSLLKNIPPGDPETFTGYFVTGGIAADCSGASPVASALDLRRKRDFPRDRFETNTYPLPAQSKPDISTLP